MFKRSANQALLQKISSSCLYIEYGNQWISAVILTKNYAVTALHCVPQEYRVLRGKVTIHGSDGMLHEAVIHGMHQKCDYIVFRKVDGEFGCVPEITYPMMMDKYVAIGYPFGEKKPAVRVGHISSLSDSCNGFFYGDSGGLPGFSGGGVFYGRNGALIGISRGNQWEGKQTHEFGDVLEMVSVNVILGHIEFADNQEFNKTE